MTIHTLLDCLQALTEQEKNSFNIISDRVFYLKELKDVDKTTYDRVGNFDLHTIDVRWTNLCNFACVYCGPQFSSKWASELNINQDVPTEEQRAKFKDYIFKHAGQLKHVYLAGGEPLLMKENLDLLRQLNPDVNLRINTNLSKVNTGVFEAVCQFKNVHWTVSIETMEDEFEYIRFGGKWADFLDNLNVIKELGHKISFNMLHFLLNYNSIFNCIEFLQRQGFHNNSFIVGALTTPEQWNVRHLPDHILEQIKQRLQEEIDLQPGYLLENGLRNVLSYIQQPFNKQLNNSLAYIAEMDQRRGLNSRSVFTKFYNDIK